MRRDESDNQTEAKAEENNKRILADLSATAKSFPDIVTEWTPLDTIDTGLHEDMAGLRYEMALDNEPICCQKRLEATETIAVMLEELPRNPEHLEMMYESDIHVDLSEEVLPRALASELRNDPKANPCNSTTDAPDEGKTVRPVVPTEGLSKENDADRFGEDCALEAIRPSLPSTEDEILHSNVEADTQMEASHDENPTLVEAEYPADAKVLPVKDKLVEPELGAFLPLVEMTRGVLKENPDDKPELCMAAEAIKDSAADTPDAALHLTEVSERKSDRTTAEKPNRNLSE